MTALEALKQAVQASDPIVTSSHLLIELLGAPLGPGGIQGLAQKVLSTIYENKAAEQEFILDASGATNPRARKLIRPLIACLAKMSAEQAGVPVSLYGGHISFKRNGPEGWFDILGDFENTHARARATFRADPAPKSEPIASRLETNSPQPAP
jgi:hypothetical protein